MKTVNRYIFAVLLGAQLAAAQHAGAAVGESRTSKEGAHAEKRAGVIVGLGNPYPGLLGINGAYNLDKNIRLTAGYSEIEVTSSITISGGSLVAETVKATTYAVGAQYLFTDWNVRPAAGLSAGYFRVSGDGEIDLDGFDKSTGLLTSNVGLDWIADNGYTMSTGMNMALAGGSGTGFYLNAGYFF